MGKNRRSPKDSQS